ncbi:MAG: methyltransferase [Altibacter sp.]|uniref:methyltransferase domain-containing protein n=1 Tax=Altibacter sp. TaxID=2024823 RepID=UPI000C8941AB|nr:methyltransferase domain-containing protein [Altibacter sp.]MAP55899.1 methyltransferase [Altibacter sp.]|tara:strand:- start:2590 stop:3120 length:531 start_codon:yes stop_codon:yes gene_type:complete
MKLHLGCGIRNFGEGWDHIDYVDYPHVVSNDVTKLPYEDDSCDVVYASHLLPYFDRLEVPAVLKEWRRVLKTGGILRIAVSNFRTLASLYCSQEITLDQVIGPLFGRWNVPPVYQKTTYDFTSLKTILTDVGFTDVNHYNWRETEHSGYDDHSQAYIPHMDKDNGTLISLNVEAIK